MTQILAGKTTVQLGDITTTRDFNFISDTVDAFLRVAESEKTIGRILNVGSGRDVSIRDLVEHIAAITRTKVKITTQKQRLRPSRSEVERLCCDAHLIQELCGWSPQVSLEEGLKKTCQWLKKNLHHYKPEIYNV
jgi:nucleoside-diphosphate-sugar epimerase